MTNKVKAHTRYRNKNNEIVVGTTTITGLLNKPQLVRWANNLGLEGISTDAYVDELKNVGTLAHLMIEDYINKKETDFSDFTDNQRDKAENAVLKFFAWEKENKFEPKASELKLVSEEHQFGGQIDIYAMLNDVPTLIDLKTSKACYAEHFMQVSAYSHLLLENGHKVEDVRILRIGRNESEGFDDIRISSLDIYWGIFKHLLGVYYLQKKIKRGEQ